MFAVLALFSALALLNYWPVLTGKVPFPRYVIQVFPPWHDANPSDSIDAHYAELGDLAAMFYPWRTFAAQAIRRFQLPLWNHHILGGVPFLANGQSAIFYPINFLYYFLPVHVAWSIRLMLVVVLAGSFMAIFVRAIGGSFAGSIGSGIVYSLSGFVSAWQAWPHADAAVWLPLIFFSIHRLSILPTFGSVLLAVFSLTMPALAGHPETAIHIMLAAIAFACTRFAFSGRRYVLFGLAAVLAVGIAAVQLIPTAEWVRDITHRTDIIWPSARAYQILGLFSRDNRADPNSAGVNIPESASYVGMLTLLLLLPAFRHRNKRDVVFFVVLAAAALQLIFGIGPLSWMARQTPIIQGLKHSRLWLAVDFSFAVLAGLGLSTLRSRLLGAVAVALLAIDVMTYSYGYIPFSKPEQIFPPSPLMDFLRAHTAETDRVAGLDAVYGSNFEMMYGLSSPAGFELTLRRPREFLKDFSDYMLDGISLTSNRVGSIGDRRLDLLNVKYLVTTDAAKNLSALAKQPDRFLPVYSYGSMRVFENRSVLPRAFLVPASEIRAQPNEDDQLEEVSNPAFDPLHSVVLSKLPDRFNGTEVVWNGSNVASIEQRPNGLNVTAETNVPAVLVVGQMNYAGWKAYVDGKPAPVLTADYALSAVALTSGRHRIELKFEPASVRIGMAVTFFTLSGICAVALFRAARPIRWLVPVPIALALASIVLALTTPGDGIAEQTNLQISPTSSVRFQQAPVFVRFVRTPTLMSGYARIDSGSDSVPVGGFSVIGYGRSSEVIVPISQTGNAFVIPFQINSDFRSGLVVANPGDRETTVSFSLPSVKSGRLTITANGRFSAFLDEPPFNVQPFDGTRTVVLQSKDPIVASSLLTSRTTESDFHMAVLPAISARPAAPESTVLPFLVDRPNEATTLVLTNPGAATITGRHRWFDESGHLKAAAAYSLAPYSALDYRPPVPIAKGFVEIAADKSNTAAAGAIILFEEEDKKRKLITSITDSIPETDASVYVEGALNLETSVLIANPHSKDALVQIGSSAQPIPVRPFGFVTQAVGLSHSAMVPVHATSPIVVTAIRKRNIDGAWSLVSALPPASFTKGFGILPQLVTGGWFTTRLAIFSAAPASGGFLRFVDGRGQPLSLPMFLTE